MYKFFSCIILILLLLVMSGCTAKSSETKNEIQVVDVEIILPEIMNLNEESTLKVKVTQGKENVEDAEDVQFEIWRADNEEDSEMIGAEYEKDGLYSIKKTFEENGIYYVQTHVEARDLHVMPKKQFIVGEVSEEDRKALDKDTTEVESDHNHS